MQCFADWQSNPIIDNVSKLIAEIIRNSHEKHRVLFTTVWHQPKEAAVQITRASQCQTDFEPPVEKSQQTSADIAIQTTEVYEQAVRLMCSVKQLKRS